ncbi:3-oxoacyl-ACP reductase [Rhodococcus sp. 06-412-2C]|uniref:SDR family NAD(P)-dependent oxidoreductase n=1 Tax=unclassified Rhodococcus (in: high G+C Gram-positive bacteria) TaxID=192944 RepID=UPI000B9B457C|nr:MULTISPECIES: SDR family oxidoreductase [unclassified Rhodococcus (in: high G+C Gram-positive bacteria)]OZC91838.1 3-oxoacyl-ACP reductase [Rhodococcus sp. 06-412-2C]OZC92407.1 3-oxoacyl-ACP reductase [Rhodococcus sp. 06-412-2B]
MTRIALVTGANRGLGRATALALARNKINVVAAARSGASEVADAIVESGGDAIAVQLDVADLASIEEARVAVLARIGQEWNADTIDVLVNNAGVGLFAPLGTITAEDFDETIAVNVRGPLFVVQAFLPHLSEGASIVNVSSSLSRHVSPATSVYAASKSALEALTRTFALELGPRGIRVNSVAPGPTATDFNGGAMRDSEAMRTALSERTALGRVGNPDDIADAISALVSHEFRWATGERIEVSGGVLM